MIRNIDGSVTINIEKLMECIKMHADKFKELHGETITITEDLYWATPLDQRYEEPDLKNIELFCRSIIDDIEFLESSCDDGSVVMVGFSWVSSIFDYIAIKYGNF